MQEKKVLRIAKWFAQKNNLDSMKYRGSDYVEFEVTEIVRETENALLVEGFLRNRRTEQFGPKKMDIKEIWIPKSVIMK